MRDEIEMIVKEAKNDVDNLERLIGKLTPRACSVQWACLQSALEALTSKLTAIQWSINYKLMDHIESFEKKGAIK